MGALVFRLHWLEYRHKQLVLSLAALRPVIYIPYRLHFLLLRLVVLLWAWGWTSLLARAPCYAFSCPVSIL